MAQEKLVSAIAKAVDYVTKVPERPIDNGFRMSMEKLLAWEGGVKEAVEEARHELGLSRDDYNIAVAGARGVGKSSLINALLSLGTDQAAPVGRSEGVLPKKYHNPNVLDPKIVMWELPGAGVGHPADTYFFDKKLYAYDHILLVSDRFTRVDFQVAKATSQLVPPLVTTLNFVRTKADVALRRMLESPTMADQLRDAVDHVGRRHVVEAAIQQLKTNVLRSWHEGMRLAGLTVDQAARWERELYIVSCQEFEADADVYIKLTDQSKSIDQPSSSQEATDDDSMPLKIDEDRLYVFLTNARRQRLRKTLTTQRLGRSNRQ